MSVHASAIELSDLERRLLNDYQRGLPLEPRPFARIAAELGVGEDEVLDMLQRLEASGALSRVGAVFAPNRVGASTLAAMAVPPGDLERVAALVSEYPEVNHNYEREHDYNLWFVITAADRRRLDAVIDEIAGLTGLEVLDLPMLADYHIDLAFDLDWSGAGA